VKVGEPETQHDINCTGVRQCDAWAFCRTLLPISAIDRLLRAIHSQAQPAGRHPWPPRRIPPPSPQRCAGVPYFHADYCSSRSGSLALDTLVNSAARRRRQCRTAYTPSAAECGRQARIAKSLDIDHGLVVTQLAHHSARTPCARHIGERHRRSAVAVRGHSGRSRGEVQ
jgi:hypothetical protein